MGKEAIGCVLGQQCAPVIAGIKPSNLLILEKGNQSGIRHALQGTELSGYLLYTSDKKDYWLLFDAENLKQLLDEPEKNAYLRECGYDPCDMKAVLVLLAARFRSYKLGESGFPHEMGILFGYPLGDVRGFIENGGQNFKMSGYWKVYDDVAYADRIFNLYESVKETALKLCAEGLGISDIWKRFRGSEHPVITGVCPDNI